MISLELNKEQLIRAHIALASRIGTFENLNCSANSGYGMAALVSESLWHLTEDEKWRNLALTQLELGCATLNQSNLTTSFFRSAPGFAWVVSKIGNSVGYVDANDVLTEIGRVYLDVLRSGKKADFDLIDGIVGLVVFARSLPVKFRQELLDILWAQLIEQMPVFREGFSWSCGAFKQGCNLGLAHGIPGVLAAFSAALIEGWDCPVARKSLIECGHWLWSQKFEIGNSWSFPYSTGGESPARLGWCYGVLGIGIAFVWLSILDARFVAIAKACLNKSILERISTTHEIGDDCVCHGHVGYTYLTKRIFESVGLQEIALDDEQQEHDKWIIHNSLNNIYSKGEIDHVTQAGKMVFHTILEGAPGVALACAGLYSKNCRTWEGLLLLDIPTS